MDDDYCYVTLCCHDCDNSMCPICPLGVYIEENDMRGCTRRVHELLYARYRHETDEELPFCKGYTARVKLLNDISKIESAIYSSSVGRIISPSGKVNDSHEAKELVRRTNLSLTASENLI